MQLYLHIDNLWIWFIDGDLKFLPPTKPKTIHCPCLFTQNTNSSRLCLTSWHYYKCNKNTFLYIYYYFKSKQGSSSTIFYWISKFLWLLISIHFQQSWLQAQFRSSVPKINFREATYSFEVLPWLSILENRPLTDCKLRRNAWQKW